ncbi:Glucokinase [Stieleria magnilauensis]|uniref:Glucokinase n=2 Tax=Stieleria magnilauensis TaxID=2527963 RepID=A0ABX5XY09_9BACT|nr:Glucokinase [Planctomycetes bacterium TBK1r]
MATGGVFVGGGIAPRILPALQAGDFAHSFVQKGRLRSVLADVPVRVMLTGRAALLGVAQCAHLSAGGLS